MGRLKILAMLLCRPTRDSIAREILGATRESDAHVDALTVASI
jgi:hypothetical protein